MRKNSIKNYRINGEVARELSHIIARELKDPRISPMTSVVKAEVTADLKYCKAYVSVYGDEQTAQDTMKGLESANGFIRRELASRVNLRITPEIEFILDQSIAYGVEMTKKIDDVISEDEAKEAEAIAAGYREDPSDASASPENASAEMDGI